jgi:hypothetical protein
MSNYVKIENYAAKDDLISGNPLKLIKGTELNSEFNAIQTAIGTKADLASPSFTGSPLATTPDSSNNSDRLATTSFVQTKVTGLGYLGVPQNAAGAGYTLVLADAGKHIYYTGGATTFTVPTNASVAFPIGTAISIINNGSGAITISTASLTVYKAGTSTAWASGNTLAIRGLATLIKVAENTWFISGAGLS